MPRQLVALVPISQGEEVWQAPAIQRLWGPQRPIMVNTTGAVVLGVLLSIRNVSIMNSSHLHLYLKGKYD